MTSKPFSFHHKMNKVIQISNLTQPVFELHIWPCPLLVPEGLHRLCAFQCDQWLTQNLFVPGDFSKHFHIIASAKAKRTGVIILFYRCRHWATEQLWLVLVTSSSVSVPGTGPNLSDNKPSYVLSTLQSFKRGPRNRAGSTATERGMEEVMRTHTNIFDLLKPTGWWLPWAWICKESFSSPSYVEAVPLWSRK